jgi:hypothetical protein
MHGNVALIEGYGPSGLWKRLQSELASFENSGDRYRIVFAGPHPTRHHVTGLPERCLAGYRAASCENCDPPGSRDIRRSNRSDPQRKPQQARQQSSNDRFLPAANNVARQGKVNWNQRVALIIYSRI